MSGPRWNPFSDLSHVDDFGDEPPEPAVTDVQYAQLCDAIIRIFWAERYEVTGYEQMLNDGIQPWARHDMMNSANKVILHTSAEARRIATGVAIDVDPFWLDR
jgi:hypothetical protein